MLKYMLDTNIVIYVIKRRPIEILDIFNAHAGQMCISSISILFKLRGLPINKYIRYGITSTLDAKKVFYKELKSSFKVSSAV